MSSEHVLSSAAYPHFQVKLLETEKKPLTEFCEEVQDVCKIDTVC